MIRLLAAFALLATALLYGQASSPNYALTISVGAALHVLSTGLFGWSFRGGSRAQTIVAIVGVLINLLFLGELGARWFARCSILGGRC